MAARRYPCASWVLASWALVAVAEAPLRDAPVLWHADDQRHLESEPEPREARVEWNYFADSIAGPVKRAFDPTLSIRRAGRPFGGAGAPAAANVNRLDEVPDGAWFQNRLGLFDLAPEELRGGPGPGGPDTGGPWTVVRAKTEGVTPGFTVRDVNGDHFLIKFDPPGYPAISTGAGVISQRILHAAGYHVPDDNVVYFDAGQLQLKPDLEFRDRSGVRRVMTRQDLDQLLEVAPRRADGKLRAIASRFLSGTVMGPFSYESRRKDDANDRIPHDDRRELRGLAVFAAWINHFDTKQANSLDMLVEVDGRRFIRHHLIDFASTLGTGADGPAPRFGYEYTFDPKAIVRRTLQFGLSDDDWRQVRRDSELPEIGYFDVEHFDPRGFAPLQSNPAFVLLTPRDGYWAAKIISAFRDEHLRAFVEEAQYRDPRATERMTEILAGRRDKLVRSWFDEMPPLDFFRMQGDRVIGHDLGVERGYYPASARYRVRTRSVDSERHGEAWSAWSELDRLETVLPRSSQEFTLVQWQVDRGDGYGRTVEIALARRSGRVVAVKR